MKMESNVISITEKFDTWHKLWTSLSTTIKRQLLNLNRTEIPQIIRLQKINNCFSFSSDDERKIECYVKSDDNCTYTITRLLDDNALLDIYWNACCDLSKRETLHILSHITFRTQERSNGGFKLCINKGFENNSSDREEENEEEEEEEEEENFFKIDELSSCDIVSDCWRKIWFTASNLATLIFNKTTSSLRLTKYDFPEDRYISIASTIEDKGYTDDEFRTINVPIRYKDEFETIWTDCLNVSKVFTHTLKRISLRAIPYSTEKILLYIDLLYEIDSTKESFQIQHTNIIFDRPINSTNYKFIENLLLPECEISYSPTLREECSTKFSYDWKDIYKRIQDFTTLSKLCDKSQTSEITDDQDINDCKDRSNEDALKNENCEDDDIIFEGAYIYRGEDDASEGKRVIDRGEDDYNSGGERVIDRGEDDDIIFEGAYIYRGEDDASEGERVIDCGENDTSENECIIDRGEDDCSEGELIIDRAENPSFIKRRNIVSHKRYIPYSKKVQIKHFLAY